VVTGTPAKGVKWRETYGLSETQVYDDAGFDRIIEDPAVDVVCIVLLRRSARLKPKPIR
jgi:glucose-fructose oxidoreductase